jgi:hypothetical protein
MTTRNKDTTFIISGGAGRVICAIPALEKYHRLNPNDDFNVIVHGWESLLWSHPILQHRTIGVAQKGTFDNVIRSTRVVSPEPYQVHGFYNQKLHLAEAFDEIINQTDDHSDLNYNCLHLSRVEIEGAKALLEKYKSEKKSRRSVAFQPYGSGVDMINHQPIDRSNRSLLQEHSTRLIQEMSKSAVVLNASHPKFRDKKDTLSVSFDDPQADYLRRLMGLIYHCDLFVGVDSLGHHIARAFDKPSIVFMGGTCDENYAYPNHSTIVRKENRTPVYSPWRLSDIDVEFSDRANDGIMEFTDDEFSDILNLVNTTIGGSNPSQNNAPATQSASAGLSYE